MFDFYCTLLSWSALGGVVYCFMCRYGYTWRYWNVSEEIRLSMRQAAAIKRRWPKLADQLGLTLSSDKGPVAPRIRTTADAYGVITEVSTVPGIGLKEIEKAAPYLSDAWGMTRVSVSKSGPGIVRIRSVRRDPLEVPVRYEPKHSVARSLESVYVGVDEFSNPVNLRIKNVSGTGVYGLPGYGKTSFILGMISELASSPAVQFVGLDGKVTGGTEGDFGDVAPRFAALVGDDLEEANELLQQINAFGAWRSSVIRDYLRGGKNIWTHGPTIEWPLLVVILDECHTYFQQVRDGGDKKLKARNSLAAHNAMLVESLVKKRRSVGIWAVLATQKGTGDAIPTPIRDVCGNALSFAQRTEEASVAALGADIRNYPDANPISLQDPAYVGVASMVLEGKPGFTRFRNPYCSEVEASYAANMTSHLLTQGMSAIQDLTVGTEHRQLITAAPGGFHG